MPKKIFNKHNKLKNGSIEPDPSERIDQDKYKALRNEIFAENHPSVDRDGNNTGTGVTEQQDTN